MAVVGRTRLDVRRIMVEGRSGILRVCPPWNMPEYQSSNDRIVWPNGSVAYLYSAETPDALRGPGHQIAWGDEVASWQYLDECLDNLTFTMSEGIDARVLMTTTPRAILRLRKIQEDPSTVVVNYSTFMNRANLPRRYMDTLRRKYGGTRIGLQEIYAHQLLEAEGALWTYNNIHENRDLKNEYLPSKEHAPARLFPGGDYALQWQPLSRIVVAVDPAVTSRATSDETGIIVAGINPDQDIGYILEDLSGRYSPNAFARRAISAYRKWEANTIVAEVNNGGDLVEEVLRTVDSGIPYKEVRASKGKRTRAEPVASLYEQNRIRHVGEYPELELEMTGWEPDGDDPSPSRMDAMVWAITELGMIGDEDTLDDDLVSEQVDYSSTSAYDVAEGML